MDHCPKCGAYVGEQISWEEEYHYSEEFITDFHCHKCGTNLKLEVRLEIVHELSIKEE